MCRGTTLLVHAAVGLLVLLWQPGESIHPKTLDLEQQQLPPMPFTLLSFPPLALEAGPAYPPPFLSRPLPPSLPWTH